MCCSRTFYERRTTFAFSSTVCRIVDIRKKLVFACFTVYFSMEAINSLALLGYHTLRLLVKKLYLKPYKLFFSLKRSSKSSTSIQTSKSGRIIPFLSRNEEKKALACLQSMRNAAAASEGPSRCILI